MPDFAQDLGHGDAGFSTACCSRADAAGALSAGIVLEGSGWLQPRPRTRVHAGDAVVLRRLPASR